MKLIRPDFDNSILNVSNSLLKYYNVAPYHNTHPLVDDYLKTKPNHIIYILLDGMGVNLLNKLNNDASLKKFNKQTITSVFPPTTVAATNAVLSGKTPIETGYLGWVQYFKELDDEVVVFLNSGFYNHNKYDFEIRDRFLKYDNILKLAKDKNPDLHTNILFPKFITPDGATSFQEEVERVLMITHNTDSSFNYLYWAEPDSTEHKFGATSKKSIDVLTKLNQGFEELIQNITEDTLVICIADHGLTDIEEIKFFEYDNLNNMLKRKPSIEPRAINFFVKEEYIDSFKEEFNKNFKEYYQLLTKEDLLSSEILGTGKKHELIDMFLGDYLAIAVNKYMFSVKEETSYKAHHAGLTSEEMEVPLILYKK